MRRDRRVTESDSVNETAGGDPSAGPTKADSLAGAPPWIMGVIRRATWRVVGVVLTVSVLIFALLQARGLVSMLVISLFFGMALDPGVTWLSRKYGWHRGVATGAIFGALVLFVVAMIFFLIPAVVEVSDRIAAQLPGWLNGAEDTFHITIGDGEHSDVGAEFKDAAAQWAQDSWKSILGLAGSALGLVFQFFTVAMFTFYFAADAPKIRDSLLRRLNPERQQRLGWAWDTAVEQTGGYFYSRLLLMLINGGLFFVAMVIVGVPWVVALPMSVFEGFVAEFIPAIGTYLGAAVPVLVTLGLVGFVPAVVLIVWTVIYQQVENYFLSPKISARTMELNGGVAFGAALAGGAIGGPMGAFMALPIAAWITSFVEQYSSTYPLTYVSRYDRGDAAPQE
jgi:predicted PurR-regulated permease PerM